MKILASLICVAVALMLFRASSDFPDWGDPDAPAHRNVSPEYIKRSVHDMETPNVVSAVLADYRGFDTMLETSVVLIAAVGVVFILRRSAYVVDYRPIEHAAAPHHNLILITVGRLLIPVMQLFALYVLIHGHHSPGGGFQGGVIMGATLILHALIFGLRYTMKFFYSSIRRFCCYAGVALYFGTGLLCLLLGGNFLDYSVLSKIFFVDNSYARSLGILLVETGSAITVMAVMFSIYADLASSGDLDRGI